MNEHQIIRVRVTVCEYQMVECELGQVAQK